MFGLNHIFELVNSVYGTKLAVVEAAVALGYAGPSKTPLSLFVEGLSCAHYVRDRFLSEVSNEFRSQPHKVYGLPSMTLTKQIEQHTKLTKDLILTIIFKTVASRWTWLKYERAERQKFLSQLDCDTKK